MQIDRTQRWRSLGFLLGFILVLMAGGCPGLSAYLSPSHAATVSANSANVIHLLNRITFGIAPGDIERVQAMGIDAYIDEQLHPEAISLPSALTSQLDDLSLLHTPPAHLFAAFGPSAYRNHPIPEGETRESLRDSLGASLSEALRARLLQSIASPRQLEEVMVDFWFNHFNVFCCGGGGASIEKNWIGAYEQTAIRPHIWGNFRQLLGATAHHPAMQLYLDNWQNTAPNSPGVNHSLQGLNENYARELMELHTLGIDGGYTQADVETLATIFTGWGLARSGDLESPEDMGRSEGMTSSAFATGEGAEVNEMGGRDLLTSPFSRRRQPSQAREAVSRYLLQQSNGNTPDDGNSSSTASNTIPYAEFGFGFDASRHDSRDKIFLGIPIPGGYYEQGEQALDILASHPATARHISYKLAQYFVADDPPESLVNTLTETFLRTDGNLRSLVDTLLHSPEFWSEDNRGNKFKTPYQFVISAMRAVGADANRPFPRMSHASGINRVVLGPMNMPLYGARVPSGYSNLEADWLNADALLLRTNFAARLARPQPSADYDPEAAITQAIGPQLSDSTTAAIAAQPPELRTTLMLGSPEMMYR